VGILQTISLGTLKWWILYYKIFITIKMFQSKGIEKVVACKQKSKKIKVAILILDKAHFRIRKIFRNKKRHHIVIEQLIL
jgi:hypothetical protein